MKPLSTDQIRQAYLEFFRGHSHAVITGASLIPENDPTVLFTTAGMHPLVPYLLGEEHPAGKRLVDVQRCIRTQDIDEVGDSSHLTMFEMLGNWSLGDYFKEGAIKMSYEFLTEVLGIPVKKLGVTCFEGDSDAPRDTESAVIWKNVGIPEERIGFLPKAKNWWGPAGQTGPCGPDTEMFYWIGETELPPNGSNPANDEANWMEIWNDVFMQYNKNEDGTFEPLKQQNVDTGMGLERVAAVLQGVSSVYDTDRLKPIVDRVSQLCHSSLDSSTSLGQRQVTSLPARQAGDERHLKIITDHLKAAVFIIADGVSPSNVDQGYVLRKLIRRAIRSARLLDSQEGLFTAAVARAIIEQYKNFYGALSEKENQIIETLDREERQFNSTLQAGLKRFSKAVEQLGASKQIDGMTAFHLYDTYGFPLELTKELAQEQGLAVNDEEFKRAFEEHQQKSRAGAKKRFAGGLADHSAETTKLHTATHLLNAALRKVLGDHIWQKGSNVTAERLRFDFSHPQKMTPEQIADVEKLVNDAIEKNLPVSFSLMTVAEAKHTGAIGVFEDRYAEKAEGPEQSRKVKVYTMGDVSVEICGGPHVSHTGILGLFKIQKEEAVSTGVRRIKATVSEGPVEIEVATEK